MPLIRKPYGLIALLFLLTAATINAQEEFVEPPSRELTKFEFVQFTGGVVMIRGLFDNFTDSLNFILDTGSGGISLDSTTAVTLGLKASAPERLIRGIGGTRKVGFLRNHSLKLGNLVVDSLDFHVIDYEVLSALYGERIDGIIGYSLLKRFIVKLNYDDHLITICSNGSMKYPRGGHMITPRIQGIPFAGTRIEDAVKTNFNYLFDIGAGLTVLFSKDFVEDSAFLKTKRKLYLKQGEGLGGKIAMYITVMNELRIGQYKFKKVPVNIFEDTYNVTSYPTLGGLIGNDIFRRFNCIINYAKRQIHIVPNSHFRDPFDYAYSGIELYLIDGKAITGEIPPGSPAERAGFKGGDEVLAVNNKFGMSLNDLKQALQSSTGKVKVIIRRNGELMNLTMDVINILYGKSIWNTITEPARTNPANPLQGQQFRF